MSIRVPPVQIRPRVRRTRPVVMLDDDPFAATIASYVDNLLVGTPLLGVGRNTQRRFRNLDSVDLLVDLALATPGTAPSSGARKTPSSETIGDAEVRRRLRIHVRRQGKVLRPPAPPSATVRANLATIAAIIGLDDVEVSVLQLLCALHTSLGLREMSQLFSSLPLIEMARVMAVAVHQPETRVLAVLRPTSRLVGSGLLAFDEILHDMDDRFVLKSQLVDLVLTPDLDRDALIAAFLPEAAAPTLEWADFAHTEAAARVTEELLAAALGARQAGVNLLLYGPTGTGKTELALLVARRLGVKVYAVGKGDRDGNSPTARERLQSLRLGHQLVGRERALLLFDELEDLFSWDWRGLGDARQGT